MRKAFLIHFLAGICYIFGAIWGIVEGLQYFIKDDSVNWMFLVPMVGGMFIAFINMFNFMKD